MADAPGKPATIRVRGSRAQIEAVKKTALEAGLLLAREQDESVSQVAQALAQITENEGLAQLEGRLIFVERQLERLTARREESDHLIDSELAVMRARLEDTLQAFAAANQEQKDTSSTVERQLSSIVAEVERRGRTAIEAVRIDLMSRMDQASRTSEALQVSLHAERRAFEDDVARRTRTMADALAAGRAVLEAELASALAEVDGRVGVLVQGIREDHPARAELLAEIQSRLDEWMSEPLDRVERLHGELLEANAAAKSEVDLLRAELLDALEASEEKALGAALHLESTIHQVRRRLAGDESEWSSVLGEAGEAVTSLRGRVEELLSRVCSLEAASASERGSSAAQLGNMARRLDLHEGWARVSMTEVSELSLRFNALESRLAALDELRSLAEDQGGTIAYLTQRIAELEERQRGPAAPPGPSALPARPASGPQLGSAKHLQPGHATANGYAPGSGHSGHGPFRAPSGDQAGATQQSNGAPSGQADPVRLVVIDGVPSGQPTRPSDGGGTSA